MAGTKSKRIHKSPADIASAGLAKGSITIFKRDRMRARIDNSECSSTWGFDIWHGKDRDYAMGGFTGSGPLKVVCDCCGRKVPPQDAVEVTRGRDEVRSRWAVGSLLCHDCRMKAPLPKIEPELVPTKVEEAITMEDDTVASERQMMADQGAVLAEDALPAEDDESLAKAVAIYNATGSMDDFARVSGETAVADEQRKRYQAARSIVV